MLFITDDASARDLEDLQRKRCMAALRIDSVGAERDTAVGGGGGLSNVDFVMRNGGSRHALRLDASPPQEWGDRFSLRGIFREPLLSRSDSHWWCSAQKEHRAWGRMDETAPPRRNTGA